MKRSVQILVWFYALLLYLYPGRYRTKYGEELQAVFNLAVNEAAQRGGWLVIWVSLRELCDLPGAIIRAHRHERGSLFVFEPGSRREVMAALAPFLFFGMLSPLLSFLQLYTIIPRWLEIVLALGMLGSLLSLFLIGVIKGLPRWFLPYVGVVLALFSVYGFVELASGPYDILVTRQSPWFLRQLVHQGQLWVGLSVATFFIVLMTRIFPPLRPFYRRIRRDWTLLSFGLYGATLFALLITFDDYPNEEPYLIAALLSLAAGGWFYLRSDRPWQRVLALFAGLTLAMAVAAIGKAILYSSPDWPYPRFGRFTWQTEATSTIIVWGWLVVNIFAPSLLNLLPPADKHLPADDLANPKNRTV